MERTLILVKPDAMQRGLSGEILSRFERRGLRLVGLRLLKVDRAMARKHYAEHVGKPFYESLVGFMSSGPVVSMAVEGPEDTFEVVRTMMGATNCRKAAPGTIRGDLGIDFTQNLVHGSDSAESAERELAIFFPGLAPRS